MLSFQVSIPLRGGGPESVLSATVLLSVLTVSIPLRGGGPERKLETGALQAPLVTSFNPLAGRRA